LISKPNEDGTTCRVRFYSTHQRPSTRQDVIKSNRKGRSECETLLAEKGIVAAIVNGNKEIKQYKSNAKKDKPKVKKLK
jgi:hypothetical protein